MARDDCRVARIVPSHTRGVWGVGLGYRMSKNLRFATQYYQADDSDALEDSGANMIGAEVEYRMQPATRLYFTVGRTENDDNAQFDSSRGVLSNSVVGESSVSAAVAVRHDF